MLMHQEASTHWWVVVQALGLLTNVDDSTGKHLSMFGCREEPTTSTFQDVDTRGRRQSG